MFLPRFVFAGGPVGVLLETTKKGLPQKKSLFFFSGCPVGVHLKPLQRTMIEKDNLCCGMASHLRNQQNRNSGDLCAEVETLGI